MQFAEDLISMVYFVYLHAILQEQKPLRNAIQKTTKATGCEMLLYVVSYSVWSWCISQEKQLETAINVVFESPFKPFNCLKDIEMPKLFELCLLKPHHGSSLDPPRFSISVSSVRKGEYSPKGSITEHKHFVVCCWLLQSWIANSCKTMQKIVKIPLRIN